MTVTVHNTDPPVTDGGDVRVRVRGAENPRVVPIRPDLNDPSACTRAISRSPVEINTGAGTKVRNFVSQHAGQARASLATGWLGSDRPQNLTTIARHLTALPGGLANNTAAITAGTFRLCVYALAYLMCFAVDTNKRAAVTAALLTLSITAAWAITAHTGH